MNVLPLKDSSMLTVKKTTINEIERGDCIESKDVIQAGK
jgi:hypothetical protein